MISINVLTHFHDHGLLLRSAMFIQVSGCLMMITPRSYSRLLGTTGGLRTLRLLLLLLWKELAFTFLFILNWFGLERSSVDFTI